MLASIYFLLSQIPQSDYDNIRLSKFKTLIIWFLFAVAIVVETYLISEIGNNIAFESYAKKKIKDNKYDYDNDNKLNMTESLVFESDLKAGKLEQEINFIKERAMSGIFD